MMSLHKNQRQAELVRSISYPYRTHGTRQSQIAAVKHRNLGSHFALLFVAGIIGFVFLTTPNGVQQTLGVSAQGIEQAAPAPPPRPKALDHTAFASVINDTIAQYPRMDIGVSWVDIKTGEVSDFGVQQPFVAASTAKLLTAISFLHDVEDGKTTLSQQVGNRSATAALEALIVESDNQAWYDFNNEVMSHAELAEYATSIGFSGYDPDNNTVTPASLAKLLANLYQRRLLSEQHTTLLLSYMERAKEVEYLKNIAPSGVRVYHKPGYLADRVHDAAIIDNNDRPYVLVIFTKSRNGTYSTTTGFDIFTKIGTAANVSFGLQ